MIIHARFVVNANAILNQEQNLISISSLGHSLKKRHLYLTIRENVKDGCRKMDDTECKKCIHVAVCRFAMYEFCVNAYNRFYNKANG